MKKSESKYLIAIAIALLIFLTAYSYGEDSRPVYVRETMFETNPGIAPLYLPLYFRDSYSIDFTFFYNKVNAVRSYPSPFSGGGLGGPSLGYFWALNCGDIIFINRLKKEIYILDVAKQRFQKLSPMSLPYIHLRYLWVGPEDEIYTGLSRIHNIEEPHSNYKLFKYKRVNGVYKLDDEFDMQANNFGPSYIRIAPNGNLYVQGWGNSNNRNERVGVFNKYGKLIKNTSAIGQTSDGIEFLIKKHFKSPHWLFDVISNDNSTILFREEFTAGIGKDNFKCTFDNHLLVYIHSFKKDESIDSRLFSVDIPYIMGKDLNSETIFSIDLESCSKKGYEYFNVADVSLNYKGEIYALFIYFNDPFKLAGDEKIVLYRWKKQ